MDRRTSTRDAHLSPHTRRRAPLVLAAIALLGMLGTGCAEESADETEVLSEQQAKTDQEQGADAPTCQPVEPQIPC